MVSTPPGLIDRDISPVDPVTEADDTGPAVWREAEGALARPLTEAVEAFARLNERLQSWDPAIARAGVERLALGQATSLAFIMSEKSAFL